MRTLQLLWLPMLLSGCLYGQCLDGPCALERERMIKSIKPYIFYWQKEGMTEEERRGDSVSCRSGGVTAAAGGIYKPDFDQARLPGETEGVAYNRLILDWERCMLRIGYRYTGNCSSDWIKTRPACGAP